MQVKFPIQCACGLENIAYKDFIHDRVIVECRCGTRLSINHEDWFYMTQVQIAKEMKRCCCDWNGRD